MVFLGCFFGCHPFVALRTRSFVFFLSLEAWSDFFLVLPPVGIFLLTFFPFWLFPSFQSFFFFGLLMFLSTSPPVWLRGSPIFIFPLELPPLRFFVTISWLLRLSPSFFFAFPHFPSFSFLISFFFFFFLWSFPPHPPVVVFCPSYSLTVFFFSPKVVLHRLFFFCTTFFPQTRFFFGRFFFPPLHRRQGFFSSLTPGPPFLDFFQSFSGAPFYGF